MKKYLISTVAGLFLLIPIFVFGANGDVLLGTGTIINTGGVNLTVTGSQASLDSITVDTDNFQVVMSGGASIQVTSSDRRTFSVSGAIGSASQTFTCSASESVLAISNHSSGPQITLTIAPNAATCSVAGGGGGASSGGGGGGGSAPSIPSQTTNTPP